jgi:flavorubredoxin
MSINHSLTPKPTKMTKATITKEINEIEERIYALSSVSVHSITTDYGAKGATITTMINEYMARLDYLNSSKEFMVHFESGGWNTCYGVNKEEALDNAKLEYEPGIPVRSVSLATSEGIKAAMSLFY